MFIQTEETPNPATLKFLPGRVVMPEGTAEFKDRLDTLPSPLARRLLSIEGIEGVFFGHDFVSVTRRADADWAMLKPHVLGALMEHFTIGGPVLITKAAKDAHARAGDGADNPIVKQIVELIETRVRPAVARDGGDIIFDRFEDGIVFLRMKGACSGCPSSSMTLKAGIETMLKHYVPEVEAVREVDAL